MKLSSIIVWLAMMVGAIICLIFAVADKIFNAL